MAYLRGRPTAEKMCTQKTLLHLGVYYNIYDSTLCSKTLYNIGTIVQISQTMYRTMLHHTPLKCSTLKKYVVCIHGLVQH